MKTTQRGRAAIGTILGVQVVTVLLGVGIPFTVHGVLNKKPVRVSGTDCDPALRWGVFVVGAAFVAAVLAPAAAGRSSPPRFGAKAASLVFAGYLATTLAVALRTLRS